MLPLHRLRRCLPLLLTLPVTGAAAADDGVCRDVLDLSQPATLAKVHATGRVPFIKSSDDDKACPNTAASCREKAFLVEGNLVVRRQTRGDFVCATYVGAKGVTRSGWLPAASLAETPAISIAIEDWVGNWTAWPDQSIAITSKGAKLALQGDATYGGQDPERVKHGAINVGSFTLEVKPEGPSLSFTDGDKGVVPAFDAEPYACSVRMRLLPPFLLAESNSSCGGMNVSFTGIYRRGG